ncbi:hypothetical protein BDW02DRAFT_356961 [Decorospora gaudefroyi]|uniref:Uncharacterized protein n=1 Tax=Decorospora gaudefroyi TaxID=184978 RepID=A0A6A5KKC5_9PLEO|nr:hypothetical protein BDW02DRAFT_356961 [Decorospora gaudefroyi]
MGGADDSKKAPETQMHQTLSDRNKIEETLYRRRSQLPLASQRIFSSLFVVVVALCRRVQQRARAISRSHKQTPIHLHCAEPSSHLTPHNFARSFHFCVAS